MKIIPLTQGQQATVNDADFRRLSKYKYFAVLTGVGAAKRFRAARKLGERLQYLHWDIIGKPSKGMVVDHRNRDPLDNRKRNLRFVTKRQNMLNSKGWDKETASEYKGVRRTRLESKPWSAKFCGRHIGYFATQEEAALAYDAAAYAADPSCAFLNLPERMAEWKRIGT